MRRWFLCLLVVLASCGIEEVDPAGRPGPDSSTTTTILPPVTSGPATTVPSTATTAVAPGDLAGRLDAEWLAGRVTASGASQVRAIPGAAQAEVAVAFLSADSGEPFAVVAGATAAIGPPVLGPVSGFGSVEQIGTVQVRVYSGEDPGRPGQNLEIAAFTCRDLSVRLVGRDLATLGEATSVAGRLINAMGCSSG